MKKNGMMYLALSFVWLILAGIIFVLMRAYNEGSIWAYASIPLAVFCSITNYKRFLDMRGRKK